MKNILSVEKIEKYYGNKDNVTKAIDNISFKVGEGEFVGIMGPSGSGKTRYMVMNACAISLPYIDNNDKVVFRGTNDKPDYQKVLFITTEQQPDEIQTMILAHVSGVNEKSILLGNFTPYELERIKRALDIIDKYGSNFIIECIPDPSIAMLRARLTKYIIPIL